ncbi:hypothetical protein LG634_09085 [Streptomyces bambusae]|uniref:hypothetical protein n=1 Tax=Streptomyces bambusae TaxID=1550616 RepID=UPI001CFDA088|nr:hypothetical protein [Streptomyces bambusae]MCB5164981.1 hypothetical protein [Streptomyces bambusae]
MDSYGTPTPRPLPGMDARIEVLLLEAEAQLRQGAWEVGPSDAELARRTADGLAEAVGPAAAQEALPVIERLEHLREALSCLALGTARTHGQLAWLLAQASASFVPVLRWRSLAVDVRHSFGTVLPTAAELRDAERAVRRLHGTLTLVGASRVAGHAGSGEPDPVA